MNIRESIINQIDVYLNMNFIHGKLSSQQQEHLYELTYNYIDVGEDWRNEVNVVLKQNGFTNKKIK